MRSRSTLVATLLVLLGAVVALGDDPEFLLFDFKKSMQAELFDQMNTSPVHKKNVKLLTKSLARVCVDGLTELQQVKLFKKLVTQRKRTP